MTSGNPAHRQIQKKNETRWTDRGKGQAPKYRDRVTVPIWTENCVTCYKKLNVKVHMSVREWNGMTYCDSIDMLKTLLWGSVSEGAVGSWLRHVGVELQNKQ